MKISKDRRFFKFFYSEKFFVIASLVEKVTYFRQDVKMGLVFPQKRICAIDLFSSVATLACPDTVKLCVCGAVSVSPWESQ